MKLILKAYAEVEDIQDPILKFFLEDPRYSVKDGYTWIIKKRVAPSKIFFYYTRFENPNRLSLNSFSYDSEEDTLLEQEVVTLISDLIKDINNGDLSKLQELSDLYFEFERKK